MKLHWIFNRYMRPADDGGSTGGGAVDRGDDFVPTGDDAGVDKDAEQRAADALAAELEAEQTPNAGAADETDTVDDTEEQGTRAKRKDTRIPLERHKSILDKERAERTRLEQELARYKQGQQVADANAEITAAEESLLEKEEKYENLLADGKMTEAKALRLEIRRDERAITEQRTALSNAAVEARAVEQVRYDMTVDRLEEAYPQINPDHEDFDKEKTAEVLDLKAAFQARGETPSKALQKAVKYVFPANTSVQKRATETEARVDKETAAEAIEKARRTSARVKALDAAGKQPASTAKVGIDHDKAGGKLTAQSVLHMKYEDFNKLDDKALADLRGDNVE